MNLIRSPLNVYLIAASAFFGCFAISLTLHTPIPRTHDEFSYTLMGETFADGHVSGPSPLLPEFFDTFHVLVRPVHASKYFPAQGLFLAVGERLTGRPAVGLWLSSAFACAAFTWMLQAWLSPGWGLLGGSLFVVQYGIFSYWSQSYWGGMVPALGGALFFGAIRRLWERVSWQNSFWLALGIVILASSRPIEGLLTALPASVVFVHHVWRDQRFHEEGFLLKLLVPCSLILVSGALALGAYNRAITGSPFKTPYALHEQQYQESPTFLFLPPRPHLSYSSIWLRQYYDVQEMQQHYRTERQPKLWPLSVARKIGTWWDFYCGLLLSIPMFLPPLLKPGKARVLQYIILAGLGVLIFAAGSAIVWFSLIGLFVLMEIRVLWIVYDDHWSRLAIATCGLVLLELSFAKWFFPHYFAPAACLVLYLQVAGLSRIWKWNSQAAQPDRPLTRMERRRSAREEKSRRTPPFNLGWVVYALPIACVLSLVTRVEGRLNGWKLDAHGPDRQALLMDDWSLDRANMEKWLEQQSTPQLVFVRYSPRHNVNFEWVYNHADIMHSHVIWARDLGAEHNKLLLNLLPDHTVWLVEADRRDPQLIPYSESIPSAPMPREAGGPAPEQD